MHQSATGEGWCGCAEYRVMGHHLANSCKIQLNGKRLFGFTVLLSPWKADGFYARM